jgi:hypothetical protein
MKANFCLIQPAGNNYKYEIIEKFNQNDIEWLEKQNIITAKHLQIILNNSKGQHKIIKISNEKNTLLYFLLEIINLKLDELKPQKQGFFAKINAFFLKNHSLNVAIPTYSNLYDFDFCIADKSLINNDLKLVLIAQSLEILKNKLEFNIVAFQANANYNHTNKLELQSLGYETPIQDFTMEIDLAENWKSFADYQITLKKKYNKRAKDIRANGADLTYKNLDIVELKQYSAKMHGLYLSVIKSQKFIAGTAQLNYFVVLKEIYGDQFFAEGIFLNNEMVGFISYFIFEKYLDIHYIGIDYDFNEKHDIYFNILFRTIEIGINNKLLAINYGRTSLDAKASLGAIPKNKITYIKTFGLTKIIKNLLIKKAKSFESNTWKTRKPFKSETEIMEAVV